MKFQMWAAALIATTALAAGPTLAQMTMQPVPNPPEKPMMMKKHHMMKHHHMMKAAAMKSDMSKDSTDMATPAPK